MRVAMLCGSHHSESTNAAALSRIGVRLRSIGTDVVDVDTTDDVPAFRPELADRPPARVADLRRDFEDADAVVFAVPEYAGGLPGWVKNITDWMVGSASLYERPVAVVSAATMGGRHAIGQLAQTLTWQGAPVVASCGIVAPLTKTDEQGNITDDETCERLDRLADAVVEAIRGGLGRSTELAATVLAPLGIDQFDRRS